MDILSKKELLNNENKLRSYAARSDNEFLIRRLIPEEEDNQNCEYRLAYQLDRDRVIHSRASRRLMHKTQVFNANKGDHYRNRLTHTLEVNQIARSIGKALGLNDELIQAIALGHDIGHTPFGHIGEKTLHLIISGKTFKHGEIIIPNFGGFKHNFQALQIIDNLEKTNNNYRGMNLTLAVREGILKHTSRKIKIVVVDEETGKVKHEKEDINYSSLNLEYMNIDLPSFTLEGQVVAISDEIAQCTHDLEDGLMSKIIAHRDIKNNDLVKKICKEKEVELDKLKYVIDFRNILISTMVGYLINDVCEASIRNIKEYGNSREFPKFSDENDVYKTQLITFSKEVEAMQSNLSIDLSKMVIMSNDISQADAKSKYIIEKLFKSYYIFPQQLPDNILERYFINSGRQFNRLDIEDLIPQLQKDGDFVRLICDHIASMTDLYASRQYMKLYQPEYL
jgi:dGTPase